MLKIHLQPRLRLFIAGLLVFLFVQPLGSQTLPKPIQIAASPSVAKFDAVMPTVLRVEWKDPLNLTYIALGDDLFLLDTKQGTSIWDADANRMLELTFSAVLGTQTLANFGWASAALGSGKGGTALVRKTNINSVLWWWDSEKRQFAATLALPAESHGYSLQSLDASRVLVCPNGSNRTPAVVELHRSNNGHTLTWAVSGNAQVRKALEDSHVVGAIAGFGNLTLANPDHPVALDATRCDWVLRTLPEEIELHASRGNPPKYIRPNIYTLSDGRLILGNTEYRIGDDYQNLRAPHLWDKANKRWQNLADWRVHNNSSVSTVRPNNSYVIASKSFGSRIVEFLDPTTLKLHRSIERLPEGYEARIEALKSGKALVLMQESHHFSIGIVGVVTPFKDDVLPQGYLELGRTDYDAHVAIGSNSVLLAGVSGGTHVEMIDMRSGRSRLLPPMPQVLNEPKRLALTDGSALMFGAVTPHCRPSAYGSCSKRKGQSAYRYVPNLKRWEVLDKLRVPFQVGVYEASWMGELERKWARQDAVVRSNGTVVWTQAHKTNSDDPILEDSLKMTALYAWRPSSANVSARMIAPLRVPREFPTVLELVDGRLALMGGHSCERRICPKGFRPTRATDLLDESMPKRPVWREGPRAHFAGGCAMQLANGRIFKFVLGEHDSRDERGLRAEVADAAFSSWERLPKPPLLQVSNAATARTPNLAKVTNVNIVKNRVLFLFSHGPTLVWDDERNAWLVWNNWPGTAKPPGREYTYYPQLPLSVSPTAQKNRVLIRYANSFKVVSMPK